MPVIWIGVAAAVALTAIGAAALTRRQRTRRRQIAQAVISDPPSERAQQDQRGAVRSVQAADIYLPASALEQIWTPMHLERLARTYWRFLSRVTLGLIRVCYTERERFVVLLVRPLKA